MLPQRCQHFSIAGFDSANNNNSSCQRREMCVQWTISGFLSSRADDVDRLGFGLNGSRLIRRHQLVTLGLSRFDRPRRVSLRSASGVAPARIHQLPSSSYQQPRVSVKDSASLQFHLSLSLSLPFSLRRGLLIDCSSVVYGGKRSLGFNSNRLSLQSKSKEKT